jgi:AcrR family transcriptional regulator
MALKKNEAAGAKPRRRRDPDGTRLAILEAAGTLLAKDGPEGLSVSQVAQLAKVNRGTAYQHFQTREQLVEATTGWVSEQLCEAVFGESAPNAPVEMIDPEGVIEHMAQFAMQNPELGRAWLFHLLSSPHPGNDPFWKQYRQRFQKFSKSESAQPGIDVDVHTVLMMVGTFLWPVWARAHTRSAKECQLMAKRFSSEIVRLSLYGNMRPERYPQLAAVVGKKPAKTAATKKVAVKKAAGTTPRRAK